MFTQLHSEDIRKVFSKEGIGTSGKKVYLLGKIRKSKLVGKRKANLVLHSLSKMGQG